MPHLCDFSGRALFVDNDMLCFGDVAEIANLDMTGLALRVVQHDYQPTNGIKMYGAVQTNYPRKNWSSMMQMSCSKLKVWSKEVVETQTGAYLHRFQDIPDNEIGELPRTWNVLDDMDNTTKLIHYTNGGPWFETIPEPSACRHLVSVPRRLAARWRPASGDYRRLPRSYSQVLPAAVADSQCSSPGSRCRHGLLMRRRAHKNGRADAGCNFVAAVI